MSEDRVKRRPKNPRAYYGLAGLTVLLFVISALGAWWQADLRWRPHTLKARKAEIEALLDKAGWVSPGLSRDKALYMVSFRSCTDCIRFEGEEFPRLQAAGVDTRVIVFAKRASSNAPERAGVAELWAARDWKTYERWTGMPVAAWTAEGLPSADTDPARAALLEKSRAFVDEMRPLLKANGISMAFPTLIWRDSKGRLRGCACEQRETYRFIRDELGVS